VFTTTGTMVSYYLDLPTGAIIILIAGSAYLLSAILSQWWLQGKARRSLS